MKYPVKFLLPAENHQTAAIYSSDFPDDIDKELKYCKQTHSFVSTVWLPEGIYRYQFNIDGAIRADRLRTTNEGEAIIEIGGQHNNGIIFDLERSFVSGHNHNIMIGLDVNCWQNVDLYIQTIREVKVIKGTSVFIEGSYDYITFALNNIDEQVVYGFFELTDMVGTKFYGANGLKESEWSVEPFEINMPQIDKNQCTDVIGKYQLTTEKSVKDFEKRAEYFDKFPIDTIVGDISKDSPLLKTLKCDNQNIINNNIVSIFQNLFHEPTNIDIYVGLLGRFAYEHNLEIADIILMLSNDDRLIGDICQRDGAILQCAIGMQLLMSRNPQILFGEEIGVKTVGDSRQMVWTRMKWNTTLYYFYQKLLKLRQKYKVLRQGSMRVIIQDYELLGIERYMVGEESIFIFINVSKDNMIVDLTSLMNYTGPIVELITNHAIKRKKVCTIFGESIQVFRMNSSKGAVTDDDEEIEGDE